MKKPPFAIPAAPEDDSNEKFDDLYGLLGIQRQELDKRIVDVESMISKPGLRGGFEVDDVRSFGTIQNAVNAVPSTQSKTIYITNTQTIAANLTIPSNISIVVLKGGSFAISTGVTLTMPLPMAGRFQIFTWAGTGKVRFTKGPGGAAFPEWWGAVPGATAGTTDSYAAIQAAAEACRAGEIELDFDDGTYQLSAGISITGDGAPIRWVGGGKYYTYLRAVAGSSFTTILSLTDTDDSGDAAVFVNYAARSYIDGVSFDGGGNHSDATGVISTVSRAQYGIKGVTNHLTLKNVRFKGFGTAGKDISGWDNNYEDCEASFNQGDGYRQNRIASNNGLSYNHCDSFSNLGWAYRFREGVGIEVFGSPALELNRKGGIFLEANVKAYKIGVIYTESNGTDGHAFTHEGSTDTGAGGVALPKNRSGTAQAGGASTITLDAGASATNDYYKNYGIEITSGTGSGQKRRISGYVGATKVATVTVAWTITPDATSVFAIKLTIYADILINGGTETEAIANAYPCSGVVVGAQVSAGGIGHFVWASGQAGTSIFGCSLNDGECALFGSYGNSSSSSFENSWSSIQNLHIWGNRGWGTDPSPEFSFDLPGPSPKFPGVSTLGNSVIKAGVTNTFIRGVSQVNVVPVDMNKWVVTSADAGGTFLRSSEVFPQDADVDVYELALGTTGTSDAYGIADINAADYEQLQGKYVSASIWMKHTDIADMTGVLRLSSSADFTSKEISMDYYTGTAVGWQRITGVFKFPSSGTVTFDVRKIEQNAGNIGSIWVTMPIICEVGADFQMIQNRTVVREEYKTVRTSLTASSTDAQGQAPLTAEINRFTTVPATNSCTLRAAKTGRSQYIRNDGANTLKIYPKSGNAINGGAVDASVTLAAGAESWFEGVDSTNLVQMGPYLSYAGSGNAALTASAALATDASKNIVSVPNTGTGNNVLSASPTLTGTIAAAAANFSGAVGVGGTHTDKTLHAIEGSAGSVAASIGPIVAESNTNGGAHILTPDANSGQIYAGSPSLALGAVLGRWNYNANAMSAGPNRSGAVHDLYSGGFVHALQLDANQNVKAIAGDISVDTAGKGIKIKEGSNARMGTATLVAGTITVSNTSVTANTRIFITRSTTGGTPGHLSYTISAATSFTVNSSDAADTSTVNWLLVEPAP